ncbi:hypothetical protein AB3X91_04415 [Paraburkholderia sp. BR14263]|uniref:hypothetical protein n=1 Tax=unclassified Paraburkholderia TaxID=2615204 RepID=UPI0034CF15A6
MQVDGLFSKDMIREYVVPAGKPVTVALATSTYYGSYGGTSGCAAPAVMFKPVAGQDYDVFLDTGRGACWTAVRHIDDHGMDEPVPVTRALKCVAEAPSVSTNAQ